MTTDREERRPGRQKHDAPDRRRTLPNDVEALKALLDDERAEGAVVHGRAGSARPPTSRTTSGASRKSARRRRASRTRRSSSTCCR